MIYKVRNSNEWNEAVAQSEYGDSIIWNEHEENCFCNKCILLNKLMEE